MRGWMVWSVTVVLTMTAGFGAKAADGDFVWAKRMGAVGDDGGRAITVDGARNVYTTGSFRGTVDFDPGAGTFYLTSSGGEDVFVSKFDSAGNFLWAADMGGISTDTGYGIAVDSAGNVYSTGEFTGSADFDPGSGTCYLTGGGTFVSKLDSAGNFLWAKGVEIVYGHAQSIALDGMGGVYYTGYFTGTEDFDPGPGIVNLTAAGDDDIFVSKLDNSGNFVWAKAMGGPSNDIGYGIAVDSVGSICITGIIVSPADLDPGPGIASVGSAEGNDMFVSKLDSGGNFLLAKATGGTGHGTGTAIATDNQGNLYVTGYFYGTKDFDPGPGTFNLTSAGGDDMFELKLDSTGNFVWAKAAGGTGQDDGNGIAVDGLGNVYTTGYFQGTADFDPGPATFNLSAMGGSTDYDIFLSKKSGAGDFLWAIRLGGAAYDLGFGIAVDSTCNTYATGWFSVTVDFNPGPGVFNLTAAGGRDIFVSKLSGPPDTTPPTVAVNQQGAQADPTNILPVSFDVVFSEAVTGFDATDVTQTGTATGTTFTVTTVNASHYTVRATAATTDGTVQPTIATGICADLSGNGNMASTSTDNIVTLDMTAPRAVTLGSSTSSPTGSSMADFMVSCDEVVYNFNDASDLVITTTGTLAYAGVNIPGGGMNFPVSFTGITGDGTLMIAVRTTSDVADAAGNGLASSVNSPTITFDHSAPTGSVVINGGAAVTGATAVTLTLTYADGAGVGVTEMQFSNDNLTWSGWEAVAGTKAWTLSTGDGPKTVYVQYRDAVANVSTDTISAGITLDSTSLTAVITLTTPSPTTSDTAVYSVDFSKPVGVSFNNGTVLPAGTLGGTAGVTGTDPNYTVTVTPANADANGTVGITIPPGVVTDLGGNPYAGGSSALCTVYNWPGFAVQPEGGKLYIGDTHPLAVQVVEGGVPTTYQWKFDNGSTVIEGPVAAQWPLTILATGAAGDYWCEVTFDGVPHVSGTAVIEVQPRISIVTPPVGGDAAQGDSHIFTVVATGGYAPLSCQWKKNGENILGATGTEYTRDNLVPADSDEYTVEISDTNSDTIESSPVTLTVFSGLPAAGLGGLFLLAAAITIAAGAGCSKRNGTHHSV